MVFESIWIQYHSDANQVLFFPALLVLCLRLVHCTVNGLQFIWFLFRFNSKIWSNCKEEIITLNIEAVSNISDINVDTPFNWLSPDPTRAKMQSVMEISAELHGTKHPSCAISTITPVWQRKTERQTSIERKHNNQWLNPWINVMHMSTKIPQTTRLGVNYEIDGTN